MRPTDTRRRSGNAVYNNSPECLAWWRAWELLDEDEKDVWKKELNQERAAIKAQFPGFTHSEHDRLARLTVLERLGRYEPVFDDEA